MSEATWPIRVGGEYASKTVPEMLKRVIAIHDDRVFFERLWKETREVIDTTEASVSVFCAMQLPEDKSALSALIDALEDILEALPKETEDADWYPDELKAAVTKGRAALEKAGAR